MKDLKDKEPFKETRKAVSHFLSESWVQLSNVFKKLTKETSEFITEAREEFEDKKHKKKS